MPGIDIHIGVWRALDDCGIQATHISGTSAGAIVGAFNAAGWASESAEALIRSYTSDMFRHERPLWKLRLPWLESIHDNDRIRATLAARLPAEWAAMRKPCHFWATRKRNGDKINVARPELAHGPVEAVLASMSICGLFPAVKLNDGEDYVDGGVRFNLPMIPPDDFDQVYLIIAKPRPQEYRGRGVVSNLIRNINLAMLDQVWDVLEQTAQNPKVRVIWPDIGGETSMLQFDHDLISRTYVHVSRQINEEKWL